jgi:phage terminase small subunit
MPILSNPKYELYAQELAKGTKQGDAYVAAGFKANTGNAVRLKDRPEIQARVAELLSAAAEKVVADEAYVLSTIKETVERCRQAAPVLDRRGEIVLTETPTGDLAPAYAFDAKNVLRGAELIGKHLGMFKERVEHTGRDGGPIEVADMSDDEKARRVAFLLLRGAKAQEAHSDKH